MGRTKIRRATRSEKIRMKRCSADRCKNPISVIAVKRNTKKGHKELIPLCDECRKIES